MSRTATPDPLIEALLREVVGIRADLSVIGATLDGRPAPVTTVAPHDGDAPSAAQRVPDSEDSASRPSVRQWVAGYASTSRETVDAGRTDHRGHAGDSGITAHSGDREHRADAADAGSDAAPAPSGAVVPDVTVEAAAPPHPAEEPATATAPPTTQAPFAAARGASVWRPTAAGGPAPQTAQERVRSTPRKPLFTAERVLAVGGALVTILGVGFLLALAIAAGLFGPVPRVLSLVVLSVVLGVISGRMADRRSDASVALAATSVAAGFGVVVAVSTIYGWVPPALGVVFALLVSAGGVMVAHRRRSEVLAALVYAQTLIAVPIVVPPVDDLARGQIVVFATVAFLAVIAVVLTHQWRRLFHLTGGALSLAVVVLSVAGVVTSPLAGQWSATIVVLLALLALALVTGVAVVIVSPVMASAGVVLLAGGVLGVGQVAPQGAHLDAILAAVLAVAFALVAVRSGAAMRPVLVSAAVLHLFLATTTLPVSWRVVALLLAAEGLVLLLTAQVRGATWVWRASVAFTAVSAALLLAMVPVLGVLVPGEVVTTTRWEAVLLGLLLAATGAVHVRGASRAAVAGVTTEQRIVLGAAVGLFGATLGLAAVGLLPRASSTQQMAAMVATTMVWVAVALLAIVGGRRIVTTAGYVLLVAAVGKLFLFDLHAVDGVLRAVLFVLTGLGLIAGSSQLRRRDGGATEQEHEQEHEEVRGTTPPTPQEPVARHAPPARRERPSSPEEGPSSVWTPRE